LSDAEVIRAYKGQAQAEGGFRLLNDPLFFAASLLVKKPLSDSRAAEGDDLSATGLFGDATPPAPPIDVPGGDGAKPAQPTDCAADLAVGLPPA
jgi:hypothetical protein